MKKKFLAEIELKLKPITVDVDLGIRELLDRLIKQPTMRHIYVVNDRNELIGIINRKKIFKLVFSDHLEVPQRVSELYQTISAQTAGDLLDRNTGALKLSDTIESAIVEMFNNEFFEIPVVDEENHPVGTLTAWDLLKNRSSEQE